MEEMSPDYIPLCTACLNGELELKHDDRGLYDSFAFDIGLPRLAAATALCWACRALLRHITGFRKQVQQSHQALTHYYDHSHSLEELLKLQSKSTIQKSKLKTLNIPDNLNLNTLIENQEFEKYVEVEIKSEAIDSFEPIAGSPDLHQETNFEPWEDEPLARRRNKKKGDAENKKKKSKKVETKHVKAEPVNIACKRESSKLATPAWSALPYDAVLVTEEQLQQWRAEDAASARYLRPPHKCSTCLVAFNFSDQLQRHNTTTHDHSLGEFACDICAARFARECDAATHRRLHLTRYECLHCEHRSRDKKDIDKHYVMEHSDIAYPCGQCDAVFKTSSQLRYHRDDKHGTRWKCKHCDKTFRLRNNMYSHMLIHKKLPEAPCAVCGKVMRNKYSLKLHLKTHEEAARTWYCRPCDAHFKLESGYRNHLNTSMKHLTPDKLKFGCEACGRRFVTEKRRLRHYNSVHLKKSEFECDKCSKTYSTKLALKNHIAQKHEENYQGPARDKICDICGKGFAVIGILKSHMRTHTGERPYQCELCPSTFSHHAALYTHKRLVHLKLKRKKLGKKKPPDTDQEKAKWETVQFNY